MKINQKKIFTIFLCSLFGLSLIFNVGYSFFRNNFNSPGNYEDEKPPNLKSADEYVISEAISDHLWSPDGTKLAYIKSAGRTWNCEIWIADKNPNNAQLTNHQLIYSGAALQGLLDWKGVWLLIMIQFEEGTPSSYYGKGEIWKIKTDGTGLIQLTFTETNGIRTTWSNSAYTNRGTATWAMWISGTNLIYFRAHNGNGWHKSYVCNDDGTDSYYHISNPDYAFQIGLSPTGNKLLWGHATYYNNPTTLRASNVDGSSRVTIKSFSAPTAFIPLADGNTVIWRSSNNDNIYAIDMDGSNEHTVIDDAYVNFAWNYNPANGQELVMTSDRSDGNMHTFKMNVDGSDIIQLTEGATKDEYPILSPDGNYLSYLRLPYDYNTDNPQPHPYDLVVKSLVTNQFEPELTNGNVSPKIGDQLTEFNFTVTYEDDDNNSPSYVNVIINGIACAMEKTNSSDNNYSDGCYYEHTTHLLPSESNYTYSFECSDEEFTDTTTASNDLKVVKVNYNGPVLNYPGYAPEYGGLWTDFAFTVWYHDIDNNHPLDVNITIDSSIYSMTQVNPADTNATDGMQFIYTTNLATGIHNIQFNCSDGMYSNSTNWIIGPEVNPLYEVPIEFLTPGAQITSNMINFSWSSIDVGLSAINYSLQISNITSFSQVIFQTEQIVQTPITTNFTVLLPITFGDYYWRIKPTSENYNGSWSSYAKFNYLINDNAPLLELDEITPTKGTSSTIFRFKVIYSDLDNNDADYVTIKINGSSYAMEMVNPLDGDFTDGCIYQYVTLLTPSATAYSVLFECSDGIFQYTTTTFQGPLVEADDIPSNNQGENNLNSANTFALVMIFGISIGSLVPFIIFAELKVRKMKIGEKTQPKLKKKELKP